jgi:cellulose synthase/poly-beta-1,6-N-acetylglucosamine synthase-like glycosyltransferase
MAIAALKSKPKNKDYSFQPFVSIIVPTYNEEKVIAKRIVNLVVLDYPKSQYEIIVVDSGSADKTTEIVEETIKEHEKSEPKLRLIKENERKGKASAINLGKKHAKGDIVLITDANSIFDKDVLKEMMPHFKDPKVGAVGGRYCIANPENPLAASESFLLGFGIHICIEEGLIKCQN